MTTRGRALRFTAISALVVLSLTGFSTGRHGHGGDGGGGCSGSGQDHDSSSSTSGGGDAYKDDDTYGDDTYGDGTYGDDTYGDDSGSGGSGEAAEAEPAVLNLVTCVREGQPWSTVEVANPNATEYTLAVTVLFKDADGTTLTEGTEEITVPADGVSAVRVPFDGSGIPDHCEVTER
ncbi:hypothetical protein [Streptomyces sp. NPDC019793]|uniref:hypothetical protein n=1 Tax=unclassified Streptomyces TaxID=2593676 RepID=UPI0033C0DA01